MRGGVQILRRGGKEGKKRKMKLEGLFGGGGGNGRFGGGDLGHKFFQRGDDHRKKKRSG